MRRRRGGIFDVQVAKHFQFKSITELKGGMHLGIALGREEEKGRGGEWANLRLKK